MRTGQNNPDNQAGKSGSAMVKSCGRSLEVTGLGVIASLVISFGTLVGDGTILLPQYLVFVALMGVSAAGMVWRLWRLDPKGRLHSREQERLQPGVYRVSFGGR